MGPSPKTQAALVQASRDDLAEHGELNVGRAAKRAGRSKASFYVYFPSRTDAVVAAFGESLADLVTGAMSTLDLEKLIIGGIESVMEAFVGEVMGSFTKDQLVMRAGFGLLALSSEARASFRHWEDHALVATTRFVEVGQQAGPIRPGNPSELAGAWMVFAQGLNNPRLLALGRDSRECHLVEGAMVSLLSPPSPHN